MYMPEARANVIGLPDTHLLAQSFYDLTIESLHTAELATINSSMKPRISVNMTARI